MTLPMLRRSAMKRWASGARSNGKASATTGFSSPFWSAGINGSITRSRLPSASHQESMLRPKTPLFSFNTPSPFHQGVDENGLLARVRSAVATLRLSPVCTSEAPYMISRPGGRLIMYGASEVQTGERRSVATALRTLAKSPFSSTPWWKGLGVLNENKGVFGLNMLSWWDAEGSLRPRSASSGLILHGGDRLQG